MRKRSLDKIKKILCILLFVSFIISATVTAISAIPFKNNYIRQLGYQAGVEDGYKVGYNAGKEDCIKYRQSGVTREIPKPVDKASWSKDYTVSYNLGFKYGYIAGYNKERFKCLRKTANFG
jgi:hypothetical protein